jgi:lipoate-protein ligase A
LSRPFRLIDVGLRTGRFNIAFDQAMLELHQEGRIGDSLRFIHFEPVALIGRHQSLSAELDLAYCEAHGIQTGRRITGGGAIYLDRGQLGWALVFGRGAFGGASLAETARRLCEAAAAGLRTLGVDARFRPRNDIEVAGRKIGGTGGFYDGNSLLYQGTVLVDCDTEAMLGALRVPRAKTTKHGLDSAAQRVVTLRELCGERTPTIERVQQALLGGFREHLDVEFEQVEAAECELERAERLHETQIGRDDFVAEIDGPPSGAQVSVGTHTGPGGTIVTYLRREGALGQRVGQVMITGDFFVAPPRRVLDLESRLRGVPIDAIGATVEAFFAAQAPGTLSVSAADFRRALEAAVGAPGVAAAH